MLSDKQDELVEQENVQSSGVEPAEPTDNKCSFQKAFTQIKTV
jgi:hypothetical protein